MLSRTSRYALRIVGFLAEKPGEWTQGREIAAATGIPANYLGKILGKLGKKGIVRSRKGWGGGFQLKEPAKGRPILGILDLFEGKGGRDLCVFEMRDCDVENPCPLHPHWERVRNEWNAMLGTVKVKDLAGRRGE